MEDSGVGWGLSNFKNRVESMDMGFVRGPVLLESWKKEWKRMVRSRWIDRGCHFERRWLKIKVGAWSARKKMFGNLSANECWSRKRWYQLKWSVSGALISAGVESGAIFTPATLSLSLWFFSVFCNDLSFYLSH